MTPFLAIVSALLIGAGDFIGGFLSRRLPAVRIAAVAQTAGFVPAIGIALVVGADRVTTTDAVWSILSGVCVGVGLMWFYDGMAGGVVSLVAPLVGVIGAVIPVVVAVARGERPGAFAVAGTLLALVAIAVVSLTPGAAAHRPPRHTMMLAVGAGLAFGLFFVFYALPSDDAGLWASPLSRLGSSAVLTLLALRLTHGVRVDLPALKWIAVLASIEVGAATVLLLAFQRGPVGIATVLASLYPVTTVLLAGIVLRERLTLQQRVAVVLALFAIVLVSID